MHLLLCSLPLQHTPAMLTWFNQAWLHCSPTWMISWIYQVLSTLSYVHLFICKWCTCEELINASNHRLITVKCSLTVHDIVWRVHEFLRLDSYQPYLADDYLNHIFVVHKLSFCSRCWWVKKPWGTLLWFVLCQQYVVWHSWVKGLSEAGLNWGKWGSGRGCI